MLGAAISDRPRYVTIRPEGHTLGRSRAMPSLRPTSRAQLHLAGFAAEHMLTGRRARQFKHEVGFAIISRLDPSLRAIVADFEDCNPLRSPTAEFNTLM